MVKRKSKKSSEIIVDDVTDVHFANALIRRGLDERRPITNLQLQKLMYFVYGHMLALHNISVGNTKFQPWTMGPVCYNIYLFMREYGSAPITDYCVEFKAETASLARRGIIRRYKEFYEVLDQVWPKYRNLSISDLINASHRPGGAWDKAYKKTMYISNHDIKREFTELINAEGKI